MVKGDLIDAGDFDKITELCKEAVASMLGFEFAHVGINTPDEKTALETAEKFSKLFNFPIKNGNSAVFAGSGIEVRKQMFLGKNGHIAIKTRYLDRAINYLKYIGVEMDEESAVVKNDKVTSIYLKEQIGDFAVHLVQA